MGSRCGEILGAFIRRRRIVAACFLLFSEINWFALLLSRNESDLAVRALLIANAFHGVAIGTLLGEHFRGCAAHVLPRFRTSHLVVAGGMLGLATGLPSLELLAAGALSWLWLPWLAVPSLLPVAVLGFVPKPGCALLMIYWAFPGMWIGASSTPVWLPSASRNPTSGEAGLGWAIATGLGLAVALLAWRPIPGLQGWRWVLGHPRRVPHPLQWRPYRARWARAWGRAWPWWGGTWQYAWMLLLPLIFGLRDPPGSVAQAQQRLFVVLGVPAMIAFGIVIETVGEVTRLGHESLQGRSRREYLLEKGLSLILSWLTFWLGFLALFLFLPWSWSLPVVREGKIWGLLAVNTSLLWLLASTLLWRLPREPMLMWRGRMGCLAAPVLMLGMLLTWLVTEMAERALGAVSGAAWLSVLCGTAATMLAAGALLLRAAHRRWCELDLE